MNAGFSDLIEKRVDFGHGIDSWISRLLDRSRGGLFFGLTVETRERDSTLLVANKSKGERGSRPKRNEARQVALAQIDQAVDSDEDKRQPASQYAEEEGDVRIKRSEGDEQTEATRFAGQRRGETQPQERKHQRWCEVQPREEREEFAAAVEFFQIPSKPRDHQHIDRESQARWVIQTVSQHPPDFSAQDALARKGEKAENVVSFRKQEQGRRHHRDHVDQHDGVRGVEGMAADPGQRLVFVRGTVTCHLNRERRPGRIRER